MPYFASPGLCVKDVTGDEIIEFYLSLRSAGLTGATSQRHHSLLHLAFCNAVKRRIIPTNPCDQAARTKANQYIGSYYNADELKTLLEALDDDPMRIPVILEQNGLRPIRFHDLRHSCASLMLANGVPMKMIQDLLSHSDMGTTANIYFHHDASSKIASAVTIGNALALSDEE